MYITKTPRSQQIEFLAEAINTLAYDFCKENEIDVLYVADLIQSAHAHACIVLRNTLIHEQEQERYNAMESDL